jgi:hypothetical protein
VTGELLARIADARRKGKGVRLDAAETAILHDVLTMRAPVYDRDPVDPFTADVVPLDEPVERAAIMLELLTWHTPEAAGPMLGRDEQLVRRRWAALDDRGTAGPARVYKGTRGLFRRRAAVIIDAYQGRG